MLAEVEDRIGKALDFQASLEDLEMLKTVTCILDAVENAWDDDAPMLHFLVIKVRLMAAMSLVNEINLDIYLTVPDELQYEYDHVRSDVIEAFKYVEEKLLTFNN